MRLFAFWLSLLLPTGVCAQSLMFPGPGLGKATVVDSTLINWWKLNEGSGTTATDYGSSPQNGTLGADVSWTTSSSKNVASFIDTSASKITFSSVSLGTTHSVSICVLFSNLSVTNDVLVGGASGDYPLFQFDTNAFTYSGGSGNFVDITTSLSNATWYRMTVVRSGTTVRLYVNTSQVDTDKTLGANTAISVAAIGSYPDGTFSGAKLMSAVRIYNRALTSGDVSSLPSCPE